MTSASDSQALGSLSHTQLVGLCLHHGVKHTGTTPELVARLGAYFTTSSPPNSSTASPAGLEEQQPIQSNGQRQRGSDEMVREKSALAPSTAPTSGSSRERYNTEGSGGGAKVERSTSKSSITSSLKSFASALVRPQKPTPLEPHPPSPIPVPSRPVTPPPVQAPGPETVRLISSPSFPPSRSAADLLEGVTLPSPSFNKVVSDLAEADAVIAKAAEEPRVSFGFGSAGYDELAPESKPEVPFVFGSPRHSVSNAQFGDAAVAVLREMNARMGGPVVSLDQLQNVMANKPTTRPEAQSKGKPDTRFSGQHGKEFAKMDSIATHYSVAASKNKKRKSEHESMATEHKPEAVFKLPTHVAPPPSLPEPSAKRARMSAADKPPASGDHKTNLERTRKSGAGRTSAAGRKSATGRKSAVGSKGATPAAGSRFGFVGRIVRSVWGGGGGNKDAKAKETKETPVERKSSVAASRNPSTTIPTKAPKVDPPNKSSITDTTRTTHTVVTNTAVAGTSAAKQLPNAPTEEPANVPNFPSVPKTQPGIGIGRPSTIAPKAGRVGSRVISSRAAGGEEGRKSGTGATQRGASDSAAGPSHSASVRSRPTSTLLAPTAASLARVSKLNVVPKPPGVRATSVASSSGATPQPAVSPPGNRKSAIASPVGRRSVVRSPTSVGRQAIFKSPLTVDAMTMRGSAPTIQPFRLNSQANIPTATIPTAATSKRPAGTATSRIQHRPRISRSKVIARLEEKRAATASTASSPTTKARSSAHARRSLGAVAAKKAMDADMERRARVRKSEAARRKSQAKPAALGRRSEGAVLRSKTAHDK